MCAQVASLAKCPSLGSVSPASYTAMSVTAEHDWAWLCVWILMAPGCNLSIRYCYPIGGMQRILAIDNYQRLLLNPGLMLDRTPE